MFRSKIATVAIGATLALGLAGCSGGGAGSDETEAAASGGASVAAGDVTVGVAMPTKSSERWIADGDALKAKLEAAGYTVDLQYAEDDIPTQVSQIENMITKGAKVLIIAAIDGTTLSERAAEAAATARSRSSPTTA